MDGDDDEEEEEDEEVLLREATFLTFSHTYETLYYKVKNDQTLF